MTARSVLAAKPKDPHAKVNRKNLGDSICSALLIGPVISLAQISEVTYRRADTTLTSGINLTDARIGAAKLLQLLIDAETAQRGYLLTANTAYVEPLRKAEREFSENRTFLEFISSIGTTGPADAEKIRTKVAAKFDELNHSIKMAQVGNRTEALALVRTDAGRLLMDELRVLFKPSL